MKYIIAVLSILLLLAFSYENVNAQSKKDQSSADGRVYFSDSEPTLVVSGKEQGERIYFEDPAPQFIQTQSVKEGEKRIVFADPSPQYLMEENLKKAGASGRE